MGGREKEREREKPRARQRERERHTLGNWPEVNMRGIDNYRGRGELGEHRYSELSRVGECRKR